MCKHYHALFCLAGTQQSVVASVASASSTISGPTVSATAASPITAAGSTSGSSGAVGTSSTLPSQTIGTSLSPGANTGTASSAAVTTTTTATTTTAMEIYRINTSLKPYIVERLL